MHHHSGPDAKSLAGLRWPLVVLAVLAASAAVTLPALAGPSSPPRPTSSPATPALTEKELREAEEDVRKEKARRASAEEKQRRSRSTTAFAGKSDAEARRVYVDELRSLARRRPAEPLRADEKVDEYLSDNVARLVEETPDGKTVKPLVYSSLPLRVERDGRKRRWSLEMRQRGDDFVPEVPLVPVTIARRGAAASLSEAGVTARPVLAAGASAEGVLEGDKAFFGNVAADTDYLVEPRPKGLESYFLLRSAQAPEQFALELDLTKGATAETLEDDAGIAIRRGDKRVAWIQPPLAWDADGYPVKMTMKLAGSRVELQVAHRGQDVLYPVTADPGIEADTVEDQWWEAGSGDFGGWGESPESPFLMYSSDVDGNGTTYRNGLHIITKYNHDYAVGTTGEWGRLAPRNAYVYRAELLDVDHVLSKPGITQVRRGIFSPHRGAWEPDAHYEIGDDKTKHPGHAKDTDKLTDNGQSHCTSITCSVYEGDPGNTAIFRMDVLADTRPFGTRLNMGRAKIYMYDREVPRFTTAPPQDIPWTDDGSTRFFTAAASDDGQRVDTPVRPRDYYNGTGGFGVAFFNFTRPSGNQLETRYIAGTLTPCGARCPTIDWSKPFDYTPSEGAHQYGLQAFDPVGHEARHAWWVRVDRSPPQIETPTGNLYEGRQAAISTSPALTVSAADGSGQSASTSRSGVKDLTVTVDKLNDDGTTASSSTTSKTNGCVDRDSCPQSEPLAFGAMEDGDSRISVSATDRLHSSGSASASRHIASLAPWEVTVDRNPATLTSVRHESDVPSGWTKAFAETIWFAGADKGTGVHRFELTHPALAGGTTVRTLNQSCTGASRKPCPRVVADSAHTALSYSSANMPEGVNNLAASAVDALNGRSTETKWTLKIDRTAPNVGTPTGEMRKNGTRLVTSSNADLAVTPTDSLSGVAAVELFVRPEGSTTETLHPNVSLTSGTWRYDFGVYPEGNHRLRLVVKDNAGNSSSDEWNVVIDRNGPRWSSGPTHNGPANGAWTNSASMTMTATAADDVSAAAAGYGAGISEIALLRGTTVMRTATPTAACTGKPDARCPRSLTPPSPFAYSATSTADFPTDGMYTMTLRATDAAGRAPLEHTWQLGVDRKKPDVILSGTAWENQTWTHTSAPGLVVDASDAVSGVSKIIVKVDNVTRTFSTSENGGARQSFSFTGLRDGLRTIHVEVHDAAGNIWTTSDWSILYDAIRPGLTGVGHDGRPADWTNSFSATVTPHATDVPPGATEHGTGIRRLKLLKNDLEWKEHNFPCEGTPSSRCAATGSEPIAYGTSDFSDGVHTLRVAASDGVRDSYRDNLVLSGARAMSGTGPALWSYKGSTAGTAQPYGPWGEATLLTHSASSQGGHMRAGHAGRIPVVGGEKYSVSFNTKAVGTAPQRLGGPYVYYYRADGTAATGFSEYDAGEPAADGWRRYSAVTTAPADAVSMSLNFFLLSLTNPGEQHYFSNAVVEALTPNNLVLSGARAMSGTGPALWSYKGSTAGMAQPYGPWGEATLLTHNEETLGGHMRAGHAGRIPVTPGDKYTVSFNTQAVGTAPQRLGGPYVYYYRADGTAATGFSEYDAGEPAADGWRRYSAVTTAPADAVSMSLNFFLLSLTNPGEQHYFSNARVEHAPGGASSWQVKVDRGLPRVTSTANALQTVNRIDYAIDDRDPAAPTAPRSGIEKIDVFIDDVYDDAQSKRFSCTTGCDPTASGSVVVDPLKYSEGTHTVKVVATDRAKNPGEWSSSVYVVGLASIDRSKLGLEDYFSYDSAETGAGTSLHVNAANGNVVWHSQPVVNKGRGLSTALNLTYNSHDRGGFLGSLISANGVPLLGATARDLVGMSYGEVGAGFSLGVGISRLNEPLAGVGLNDLGQEISDPSAITLTDRDGTAHTFRKDTANPGWFLEPAGVHLRLRKYPQGNAEKRWAFTRPDGVTFFYNSLGYQTFITDRDGNSLRFEYEKYSKATGATSNCAAASPAPNLLCAPRVVRIVDAAGVKAEPSPPVDLHGPRPTVVERRSVRIEYNPNPVLPIGTSTLLPAQLSALVPVGGKPGRIARIIDHGCRTTEFGYEDGYLKEMTQGRVLVRSSSTYKCTSDYKTMADSRTIKFDYDGTAQNKLLDDVKDAMGRSTQLDYDDAKAPGPFGTRSVGRRPDSVLNRRNFRTEFQFGSTGFTATAPGQRPTHHMLDSFGRPTTIRDALGTETELHWDTDNNVDIITEAANFPEDRAITKLTWNGNGQITRREDAEGRVTQFSYCYGTENHHADPASCPAPGSAGPHPGYVADLTKVLRAEPNTNITYGIDARGHVTSRQYDGYRASTSHYDPVTGLKMWDVDEQSNTTTYANHDENGLPWLVKDGRGNAGDPKSKLGWRYSFDELGNVRTATDPRGANDAVGTRYTADFDYDAFDRLTVARTPRSQTANGLEWTTRRASFDKNGNLSTTTDGKELVTTRRYTANDQIEFLESPAVAHAESGDQVAPEIAKYVYDERDNLTVIESPNGQATATVDDYTTRIDYDLADRPVKQSRLSRGGTASPDRITSYDYDRRGNVIGVADPRRNATGDPLQNARDNRRWHYVYDLADNRVEQVEDPGPGPDDENLRTMSIFDANGRVKEIRSPRFFKEPNNYRFATFLTYDSRDQLLTRSEGRGELYAGDADTRTTTYDRRHDGRVVKVTSPRGNRTSQVDFQTTYGYDQNGDLMTVTLPKAGMTHESDQTSMVFTRDAVGNPEKITDFRGFEVTNEFYDGGELRSTNRPSMWKLALGSAAEGGDEVTLKPWEEWGDHAGDPELPATEGNGDFGAVGAAPSPGILPKAGTTTFFYDREMQLTSVRDVANKSVEIARDEVGRVVKISHPFGQEAPTSPHVKIHNSFRYDFNGNLREFVDGGDSPGDEDGYVTKTAYDQFDLPVEVDAPGAARDLDSMAQIPRAITKTEYDENGNALKIFGPEPDVEASFTYDGFDRLSWEEDGEDDVTTYGYDSGGNQTCVAPPKANPDTVRPPQACQAGRYATIRTFDQFGQLSEERRTPQNAGEIVSTFKYDHDGNLTRETLPGAALVPGGDVVNHVIDRTYDGRGLPHTESMFEGEPDPGQRGRWIKVTEYDPNGNLRRTIGKSGLYEIETGRWEPYGDPDNNLAVEPDVEATQRATVNVYNADNLIISQWRPTDSSTGRPQDEKRYHQDYNRNGRGHIESIDAAREGTSRVTRTQYAHYDNGWIEYSTDKYSTSDSNDQFNNAAHFEYTYDGRGNQLSWLTDMREVTRSFYPNGLLRTKTAEAFVGDAKSRTYDHVYNANRSLVGMRQRNGRETLVGRDKNDRVLSVLENWEGGKDTKFKYDAHGNVTQRRTDGEVDLGPNLYSGGKLTTFEYDDADRETLMRVQQSGQAEPREWETKWFPSGAMRERTKPNDTVESWTYYAGDITHHMRRRVKNPPAGDPYAKNIEYEYDADGQRTKDERGTYEYDARDQLVTWKRNDKKVGETTVQGTTVTYEHTGNGAVRRKVDDGEVTTYEFTKGDRLDYVVDDGDRWDYRHNDLGDVTKIEPGEGVANAVPTNYEYDALGRLEFAHDESTGTKGERYAYDALDRRDWKCDATSAIAACETNTRSEFVYLGLSEKTTGERQVSEETSGTKTTRSKTYDYSSALQRLGQDRITEKEQQAPTNVFRSYAHDVQGSVEGLESGDGAINKDPQKGEVTAYEYDPYGAVVNQEDLGATAKANPFRFQGFYYDDATETYDMQARAYRAPLGRFLSSDRYESAYGDLSLQLDPLTQNRYAFGSGNPVGNVELDGHIGGMAGAVDGNGKTGRSARRNLIKAQRASPLTFSAPATDQEGAQAAVNNRARAANYPAAQSGQLKVVSTRREGAKVFAKLQGAPNSGSYFETQIMHGRALQLPRRQEASNPSPVAMGIIAVGCALLCPDVTDVPGAVGSVIKPVRIADRAVDAVGDLAKGLDDAAEQATRHDERVSVYHGSIHDSRAIRDGDGLDPAKAPSTVTRDRRASENAIDPYARPNDLPFRDPGIVESRIPRDIFDELFAPLERPYPGFHDRPILSTEIQMRSPEQFKAFNTYRVR